MIIGELNHPKSIWTWTSVDGHRKRSYWIPYLSSVTRKLKSKSNVFVLTYNGGKLELDLDFCDSILFYGASADLPMDFLDQLAQRRIGIIIHRRNQPDPMFLYTFSFGSKKDVITAQILFRENKVKRTFIAKKLCLARFETLQPFDGLIVLRKRLKSCRDRNSVMVIEAIASKNHWKIFYESVGLKIGRRQPHIINEALDAGSKFLMGIILRWVLFHRLSPMHGFLHQQISYPGLVYDLMEPYRWIIESAVKKSYSENEKKENLEKVVPDTLRHMKTLLEEQVYSPEVRGYLNRKQIIHGGVLALRSYLIGEMNDYVIPKEGAKKGGRPIKVTFRIPGLINK